MPKHKVVIFVHGCFWHRHEGCKRATVPQTNKDYWEAKFKRNLKNDVKVVSELEAQGWKVLIVWECEVLEGTFQERISSFLKTSGIPCRDSGC